jgi:hypothetical protein
MSDRCAGCGGEVSVAGGIGDLWSGGRSETGGMVLELRDGTEHRLCFTCIEALPDDPTAADVAALGGEE